jgi:hypothetical protein
MKLLAASYLFYGLPIRINFLLKEWLLALMVYIIVSWISMQSMEGLFMLCHCQIIRLICELMYFKVWTNLKWCYLNTTFGNRLFQYPHYALQYGMTITSLLTFFTIKIVNVSLIRVVSFH